MQPPRPPAPLDPPLASFCQLCMLIVFIILGKKESLKIQQLEKKNIQLEKRLDACENARGERERSYSELQELKHKVDYLEELLNAKGFRPSQEFKLMLHV